jgi:TRAP-type C4-dicarboxylate transport system permease small subunit
MNTTRMAGVALLLAGLLGLMYGSFTYTKETHETKIGPLELSVTDKETVNVPVWAGVAAIVVGGGLLGLGSRKA